ncbi:cellulase family glycosylhydrolase [Labilibacter marinus]|uniref:cellulase family glycosylhydrolase n=1 Tax=Labilibacter marinus TaxID=1477105 RepID=UPI0009FAED58|nr:cellulase family glycosylhydrolase [Labilibacter marinus]
MMNLIKIAVVMLVLVSCNSSNDRGTFKTEGRHLIDANNNEFIMCGVNVPFAWHLEMSYKSLESIAQQNVNCVRIVWESHKPAQGLDSILQKCIDLKMIPMVELHDATGDTSATKLYNLAEFYVSPEMKTIIRKYEKYLLVNIANEWGDNEMTNEYWRDAYIKCIDLLRSEGLQSVIVIDAPGWGQNSSPILKYGTDLINHDPLHNLLFSVHMYGSWNDEKKIIRDLSKAQSLSLPIIVGEFGYNYNDGNNNLNCMVNHHQILHTCDSLQIGYLAWSWTGNNKENKWLDLVEYGDWKSLTKWGEDVFNSPKGIKQTAKAASVFK